MKKLLFLITLVFTGLMTSNAAKITVDNSPGSAANYSDMPAAITAANSGDTLLVYGSAYSYGNVSVYKSRLVIIGSAGFDPEVTNEYRPSVGTFSMENGCDSTVISGFNIAYLTTGNGHTVNKIGIYNNYFNSSGIRWFQSISTDWVIEGNVFIHDGLQNFIENYNNNSTLNNILFKNNYFETIQTYYYLANYNNSAFTYRNNVFILRLGSTTYPLCNSCNNVLFENNIFWEVTAANTDITGQSCTDCTFNNNIIYNSGGGTMTAINSIGNGVSGNNNIMNQDPLFVNFTEGNSYTIAENYRIANGSPGHLAGTDGMDIGLFGGNYNWENRKYPKTFPHQEVLNVINSSVPQGTPVNINIKARKAAN